MTPDTLLNRQTQTGNVRLGDDSSIPVEGKGTVNLMGVIPGGTASPIVMQNVLYVPSLGNANLFSWHAAQRSGSFYLEGTRDDILIRKGNANGKIVLWAKLKGLDYIIQTVTESAKLTAESPALWHDAFGHASNIRPEHYKNGKNLPTITKHQCDNCSLSNTESNNPCLSDTTNDYGAKQSQWQYTSKIAYLTGT